MPEVIKETGEKKVEMNKSRNKTWFKKEFSASTLLFWIKGSVAVDYRFVRIVEQNTVLGLLPAGKHKQNIPLKNISDASIDTSYSVKDFIFGVIIATTGLGMFNSDTAIGVIILLIGIGIFLNGIMTKLSIEKGGTAYEISVPFYNKQNMIEIKQAIEEALATDIDKTDQSLYYYRLAEDDKDEVK